jgi:hypothetical protein
LLDHAFHFLSICPEACCFIERHAEPTFGWFSEPSTIGLLDNETVILIVQFLMHYFQQRSYNALQKIPPELLQLIPQSLQQVMDQFQMTNRAAVLEFYAAWRSLSLRLISSPSISLQMAGWGQVSKMIQVCTDVRRPPRQYVVSNAGFACVNGIYDYAGPTTDGFFPLNAKLSYARIIPADDPKFGGRKLTLSQIRSEGERWFFSIADKEPETDGSIDLYVNNAPDETKLPPTDGWTTAYTTRGMLPPQLQPIGELVPPGHATFEHHMAAWVLKHDMVERLLRTTTMQPEMQAQVHPLMQFLFDLSALDEDFTGFGLIPALCEGSRQRRGRITQQGAAPSTNASETLQAKKPSTLTNACEHVAKSPRKRATMEMPMGRLKLEKVDVTEHQRHRRAQGKANLCSFIEKLSNRKLQLLREYRKADDDFLKIQIKTWILTINEQLANAEHDLNKLLEECEKYKARMDSASAPDESGASNVRGHSCDTTFSNNEIKTGDGKDCSVHSDSSGGSDGSESVAEEQV